MRIIKRVAEDDTTIDGGSGYYCRYCDEECGPGIAPLHADDCIHLEAKVFMKRLPIYIALLTVLIFVLIYFGNGGG